MPNRLNDDAEPLLSVRDLARYLSVSERWVYDAVARRTIPFLKVGRKLRFEKQAIEQWLDENASPVRQ